MSLVPLGELPALALALAVAYQTAPRASELFNAIGESFDAITDFEQPHLSRMEDAVADLASRGLLLSLINAALNDPQQQANVALRQVLQSIAQQNRWQHLDQLGLVLRLGPFVNRSNLKSAIEKLFLGRRVLRIESSSGARGRSWSTQLLERQAALRGARYSLIDLRTAPIEARKTPSWLATRILSEVFQPPAKAPTIDGYAENRLTEPLSQAWVPLSTKHLLVIDHIKDRNVAAPVREYVVALTNAVGQDKLPGLKLVLIEAPDELDVSAYALHTNDDFVVPVTVDHVTDFFSAAAAALYPGAPAERRKAMADAAVASLGARISGPNEEFTMGVRDALETMALM